MATLELQPIAILHSPFKEKFATPRQPGLTPRVISTLEILPEFARPEAFAGLEVASHIWLCWWFHQNPQQAGWKPTVRPPRLGGNQRLGVFATRSGFRPNPLGWSVCELQSIDYADGIKLQLAGADLIDGTPVFDIKPYVPYADQVVSAQLEWAQQAAKPLNVRWAEAAVAQRQQLDEAEIGQIESVLALDPRPAYQTDQREYGSRFAHWNIRWQVENDQLTILSLTAG